MQKQLAAVGDALDRLLEPANLIQVVIVAGMITLGWSIWRLIRPRFASDQHRTAGTRGCARPPGSSVPTR